MVFVEGSRKAKVKQEYVVFNLLPRQVWHSDVKKLRRESSRQLLVHLKLGSKSKFHPSSSSSRSVR